MAFRRLVIVGGGSAGWVAAAYLNGALNRLRKGPRVEITVVESPDVPRISVGEATIPSLNHVLEVAGIDETDFVRHTDATYKQAIKYRDWSRNDGSYYYHPFTRGPFGPIDFTGDHWARSDKSIPYMETVSAQPAYAAPQPVVDGVSAGALLVSAETDAIAAWRSVTERSSSVPLREAGLKAMVECTGRLAYWRGVTERSPVVPVFPGRS